MGVCATLLSGRVMVPTGRSRLLKMPSNAPSMDGTDPTSRETPVGRLIDPPWIAKDRYFWWVDNFHYQCLLGIQYLKKQPPGSFVIRTSSRYPGFYGLSIKAKNHDSNDNYTGESDQFYPTTAVHPQTMLFLAIQWRPWLNRLSNLF